MPDRTLKPSVKKMFLFISSQNIVWTFVLPKVLQGEIAKVMALAPATLSNWKKSWEIGDPGERSILRSLVTTVKSMDIGEDLKQKSINIIDEYSNIIEDDAVDVFHASKILGLSEDAYQKILDEIFYRRMPMVAGVYYANQNYLQQDFRTYGGIYFLWFERDEHWYRCALQVRYPLDLGDSIAIRCKLNTPREEQFVRMEGQNIWEYDGFMIKIDQRIFWIFENRVSDNYDHFYFITTAGYMFFELENHSRRVLTLEGNYLTTGQDTLRSVVSGRLLVQRQDISRANIRPTMRSCAQILRKPDGDRIQALWQRFKAQAPNHQLDLEL